MKTQTPKMVALYKGTGMSNRKYEGTAEILDFGKKTVSYDVNGKTVTIPRSLFDERVKHGVFTIEK